MQEQNDEQGRLQFESPNLVIDLSTQASIHLTYDFDLLWSIQQLVESLYGERQQQLLAPSNCAACLEMSATHDEARQWARLMDALLIT